MCRTCSVNNIGKSARDGLIYKSVGTFVCKGNIRKTGDKISILEFNTNISIF